MHVERERERGRERQGERERGREGERDGRGREIDFVGTTWVGTTWASGRGDNLRIAGLRATPVTDQSSVGSRNHHKVKLSRCTRRKGECLVFSLAN